MKSSSTAPPAAAHAQYIARDGQYQQRGGLELVESGNMPEFARENPHSFWEAADAFERKNGRAYTELQIALPRELAPSERHELARETARELLGERFAYTLAVHTPLAKDNIEQPHMHLMFSERVVTTRTLNPFLKSSSSSAMERRKTLSGTRGISPWKYARSGSR